MTLDIVVVTPPIQNLNTPYAAAPRLAAWLRSLGHNVTQVDLSLELGLRMFSRAGLERLFAKVDPTTIVGDYELVYLERARYIQIIDQVIGFLQGRDPSLAHRIARGNFLPEGPRMRDQSHAEKRSPYGEYGQLDLSRYLATLLLQDLTELFRITISPHLQFSSYGENLAASRSSFTPVYEELQRQPNELELMMLEAADATIAERVDLVCMTCPFPGQLLGSLRLGAWLAEHRPAAKRALGGGYPSTELRRVSDPRLFDFIDYLSIDDGELPLQQICGRFETPEAVLHNTFVREDGKVVFHGASCATRRFRQLPGPDYSGVALDRYLNMVFGLNRVSRLQNEGPWLKLTAAHGCYWKKCTFCDIHLPYIGDFDPIPASQIADQMDAMHAQTGWSSFHFTDEAAPPPLLVNLALELLRRGRTYRFWGNVRFDPGFTPDRCRVLAAAGMVAVTGGLEVASDELLPRMAKGIAVPQVAKVLQAFTQANILTHAYLIYGFPGETKQNTVDSLEIIRQFMAARVLYSGYYHRFTATAHSPVGRKPELYGIRIKGPAFEGFADYAYTHDHDDPEHYPGRDTYNYLQIAINEMSAGRQLDRDSSSWFEPGFPKSRVPPAYVETLLAQPLVNEKRIRACWLGGLPTWSRGLMNVRCEDGDIMAIAAPRTLAASIERCHPSRWKSELPPRLDEFSTTDWVEPLRSRGLVLL